METHMAPMWGQHKTYFLRWQKKHTLPFAEVNLQSILTYVVDSYMDYNQISNLFSLHVALDEFDITPPSWKMSTS